MILDRPPTRLGIADAGEILTVQRAAFVTEARLHGDLELPPLTQTLAELTAELADPSVRALGLRVGSRLVAAVRVRDLGSERVLVSRLVVAPDQQGQGLGRRLLVESEQVFPGTRVIELFTGEHSAVGLGLYRRCGFVETHRTPLGSYSLVHLAKSVVSAGSSHGMARGGA